MDNFTGATLKKERKKQKFSQKDLAAKLEISPAYLNLIENGHRPLTAQLRTQISDALQVVEALFAANAFGEAMQGLSKFQTLDASAMERLLLNVPEAAQILRQLSNDLVQKDEAIRRLSNRVEQDSALWENLHELLSIATSIRSTASILNTQGDLAKEQRTRFGELLHGDARVLSDQLRHLVDYLNRKDPQMAQAMIDEIRVPHELEKRQYYLEKFEQADDPHMEWPTILEVEFGLSSGQYAPLRHLFQILADDIAAIREAEFVQIAERYQWQLPAMIRAMDAAPDRILRRFAMLVGKYQEQTASLFIQDQTGHFLLHARALDPQNTANLDCPYWPLFETRHNTGKLISGEYHLDDRRAVRAFAASTHSHKHISATSWHYATMIVMPISAHDHPQKPQPGDNFLGLNCQSCKVERCEARRNSALSTE